ncbi:MAG: hypothetical protein ACRC2T_14050 [Thermoguttaceae bacterium]
MPKKKTSEAKTDGPKRRQEADFACVIAEWLREQGYEVFCEVTYGGRSGRRIDIVVKDGCEYWAVEVKTSAGLEVLEQAYHWKKDFHYVYVAVPEGRRKGKAGGKNRFFQEVAKKFGIGVIRAKMGVFDPGSVEPKKFFGGPRFALQARDKEEKPHCLKKNFLHPEMANNIPGTQGGHTTSFRRMCNSVIEYLKKKPNGSLLKELYPLLAEHYDDPRSGVYTLVKWIELGHVKGIEVKRIDRRIVLFAEEKMPQKKTS